MPTKRKTKLEIEKQKRFLETRDECGSNTDCLKARYERQLNFSLDKIISFGFHELYDFSDKSLSTYFITYDFCGAYQCSIIIYSFKDGIMSKVPWQIPNFNEDVSTCGLKVLEIPDIEFLEDEEAGGVIFINSGLEHLQNMGDIYGELLVYTKWAGHGDQTEYIFYRLIDGRMTPNRGLLDNCSDEAKKYTSVFLNKLYLGTSALALFCIQQLERTQRRFSPIDRAAQLCSVSWPFLQPGCLSRQ